MRWPGRRRRPPEPAAGRALDWRSRWAGRTTTPNCLRSPGSLDGRPKKRHPSVPGGTMEGGRKTGIFIARKSIEFFFRFHWSPNSGGEHSTAEQRELEPELPDDCPFLFLPARRLPPPSRGPSGLSFTGRELTFLCVQPSAVQFTSLQGVWWCAMLCCSCAVLFWGFALSRLGFGGLRLFCWLPRWHGLLASGISFCHQACSYENWDEMRWGQPPAWSSLFK